MLKNLDPEADDLRNLISSSCPQTLVKFS